MGGKKAVLVGCNYPGTECQLPGCVNDAKNMYFTLVSKFGFARDDITVLIDDTDSKAFDVPTGANIKHALHRMVDSATPGDVLFFLFSGHGCRVPATAHDDVTGYNECICPTDNNLIHDDDFQELVDKLPPHVTFTIVSDSCHSGGLIDKAKEQIGDSFTNREGLRDKDGNADVIAVETREAYEDDAEEEEQEVEEQTEEYGEEAEEEDDAEEEEEEEEEEEDEEEEEEEEEEEGSSGSSSEDEAPKKGKSKKASRKTEKGPKGTLLKAAAAQKKGSEVENRHAESKGATKGTAAAAIGGGAAKGFVKSMPVETLVHNLRAQTGREDVDVGNIEAVLYETFGEESSARVKTDVAGGGANAAGGKKRLGEMGVLVSGCQSYQYSRAVPSFDGGYGALTRGLITVLEASQPGITNRELVQKVRRFLDSIEFDQLPGLYCNDDLVDAPFLGTRHE